MSDLLKFGLLVVMGLLNTTIQGLLRYSFRTAGAVDSMPVNGGEFLRLLTMPTAWGALLLQVIAFGVWLVLVSRQELTYILPLSGAFFTFFLFLQGYFIFQEHITVGRLMGAALIVLGALMIEGKLRPFNL